MQRRGEEGGLKGGGELKAGLLVGFNYICLYLHNKQQPRRGRAAWYACAAFSV